MKQGWKHNIFFGLSEEFRCWQVLFYRGKWPVAQDYFANNKPLRWVKDLYWSRQEPMLASI